MKCILTCLGNEEAGLVLKVLIKELCRISEFLTHFTSRVAAILTVKMETNVLQI